jgi:hypothetical protein
MSQSPYNRTILIELSQYSYQSFDREWVKVDQRVFEESLIFEYFPQTSEQHSFFSAEELLNKAYELRMKKIFNVKNK